MAAQYGGVPGEKMKIEDSDNVLENMDTRFDGKKTSIWLTALRKFCEDWSFFAYKVNCRADNYMKVTCWKLEI